MFNAKLTNNQLNLSHAHETLSKYTLSNNPNMSKISISDLSNTHEYSQLIEKLGTLQLGGRQVLEKSKNNNGS